MPEASEGKYPARFSPVARATRAMGILGATTALIGIGLTIYLQAQPAMNLSSRIAWEDIIVWIWPTSIMMMEPATASTSAAIIAICMALVANTALYALAGFAIGSVRQKYLIAKSQVPVPHAPGTALRDGQRAILVGAVLSVVFNVVNLGGSFLHALSYGDLTWCFILLVPFTLDAALLAAPVFVVLRLWSAFKKWRRKKKGLSTGGGT